MPWVATSSRIERARSTATRSAFGPADVGEIGVGARLAGAQDRLGDRALLGGHVFA